MVHEMGILIATAITVACLHTLSGPDHYVPFIALAKSRQWTFAKTIFWTLLCGCGHVWSSVLLALGGAAVGWSLSGISRLESLRGGIAGWTMLVFGLSYGIWGLVRAGKHTAHKHFDSYDDGSLYVYEHNHNNATGPQERHKVTPWVMFLVFLLGPCEPMIPLLYFPAAQNSLWGMALLVIVYTLCTLVTMVFMVILGYYGLAFVKTDKLEKYMHAIGGFTVLVCGIGMVFLDW